MALKSTMIDLKEILEEMSKDLDKTEKGNKAAAQRVRTGSIEFAKVAKIFRKESVRHEKVSKSRGKKKKASKRKTLFSRKKRR